MENSRRRVSSISEDGYGVKQKRQGRWSCHRELLAEMVAVQDNDVTQIDEKTNHLGMAPKFNWRGGSAEGATRLFQGWLAAQAAAVGDEKTSVPVFEETIVHFRLGAQTDRHKEDEERRASHGLAQSSAMPDLFVTTNRWQGRGPKDLLFLLSVPGNQKPDSTKQGSPNQFVSNGNERLGARGTSGYFLLETGMLPKGKPIQTNELTKESYESSLTVEAGSVRILSCLPGSDCCKLDGPPLSSLGWLEKAGSEAIARLRVLLSPGARRKMKKIGFPLPGALLLHGPPVSWVQPYQSIGSGTPSISGCLSLCNWCS
jgi:hypothetical protein